MRPSASFTRSTWNAICHPLPWLAIQPGKLALQLAIPRSNSVIVSISEFACGGLVSHTIESPIWGFEVEELREELGQRVPEPFGFGLAGDTGGFEVSDETGEVVESSCHIEPTFGSLRQTAQVVKEVYEPFTNTDPPTIGGSGEQNTYM